VIRRAKIVKLLVMDVDGILTDGCVIYTGGGETQVAFDIQDGHGIRLAQQHGLSLALVTGRDSEAVAWRARELGIREVHQKTQDKLAAFQDLLARNGLTGSQAACMGDDLLDLPLLRRAGLAITVPGAVAEVRAAAHYVTSRPGGRGAVREAIELLLKAQGHWPAVLGRYQR
jgi:3-deoxy-D-manno-octulosonate 8-phosphate phosphatase (KDO 8-P phosphatase)